MGYRLRLALFIGLIVGHTGVRVGALVGAAIILSSIDDIAAISPGVAIGYGFCLPCQHHIESRAVQ
ncbi:MAG TPA: hypothetical protein EYQ31_09320 [Candidatus Handelsmanbacteria bacterium]|nr:hypothetical protein [Candidatus Handelsmanbacteria bacterium]